MTKKIMFNDKYYLTKAILDGTKTMTRRLLKVPKTCGDKEVYGFNVLTNNVGTQRIDLLDENENIIGNWKPKYEVGEVVAIAQPYKDITDHLPMYSGTVLDNNGKPLNEYKQGWNNKLFIEADLMPHHIRITNIKIECLQDISDKDILCEGIKKVYDNHDHYYVYKYLSDGYIFYTPSQAFASLIDKIYDKGTWNSNPWVVAYSFELVD